jgi:hypothetical protein
VVCRTEENIIDLYYLAGIQIFRTAIQDASITKITVLSRGPLPEWMDLPETDKTEIIVLSDFLDYPQDLPPRLAQHDACIWALRESPSRLTEEEYTKIIYDYLMAAVIALEKGGVGEMTMTEDGSAKGRPPFRFVYVSGEGVDHTQKRITKYTKAMVSPSNASMVSLLTLQVRHKRSRHCLNYLHRLISKPP